MDNLFREEVLSERDSRLHGHVILDLPMNYRILVVALALSILAAGIWVATGEYARTQTVRGMLVTTNPSVKVFPSRSGRIEQFALTEGDMIEQGALIAQIDTDVVSSSGIATADVSSRSVDERLLLAAQNKQMVRQSVVAEQSRLQSRLASLASQIDSNRAQISLQGEIVASHEELLQRILPMVERGFISQVELERRRQNVLVSEQSLAQMRQSVERLIAEETAARWDLQQLDLRARQSMGDVDGAIAGLEMERAKFEGERSYVVRAPITGRVAALQAAAGRRASADIPLLTIIPVDSELRARLYAPTSAIGMVETGQETTLLMDAFPYQRFGSTSARIEKISRTVLDPQDADAPFHFEEPVFQIDVILDTQTVNAYGQEIPLQPGMTLKANIVLQRQTFLDWLLAPLRAVLNRT